MNKKIIAKWTSSDLRALQAQELSDYREGCTDFGGNALDEEQLVERIMQIENELIARQDALLHGAYTSPESGMRYPVAYSVHYSDRGVELQLEKGGTVVHHRLPNVVACATFDATVEVLQSWGMTVDN